MPPSCAIAIAIRDSVTVSIAALTNGTFSEIFRVRRVETSTALGSTVEWRGLSRTSSNVSAVASALSVHFPTDASVLRSMIHLLGTSPWQRSRCIRSALHPA